MGIYGFYYLMWDFLFACFICLFLLPQILCRMKWRKNEKEVSVVSLLLSVLLGARGRPSPQVCMGPLTCAEYGQRSPPCPPHDSQGNKHRSEKTWVTW